jgi:hypothetical protein
MEGLGRLVTGDSPEEEPGTMNGRVETCCLKKSEIKQSLEKY